MSPRIAPLEAPYEPEIEAALAKWMPPNSPLDPLRLFRTLLVHDQLASRMLPLGAGILGRSATVPPPLREVAIHRTTALVGAEYEWGVHVVGFGQPLGFTDEQLHSTVHGSPDDPCWDPEQAAVFRLCDELHHTGSLSDDLWEDVASRFDNSQILELIVTAGWYHLIGYVCNATGLDLEDWGARFPAQAPGGGG